MSVHLNAEYPEHLNPFHTRRSSLRQSFRGFKKAIVKSFTGKDKEKPVLRPKLAPAEQTPTVPSIQRNTTEPPVAFPRSRFSERVTKTETLQRETTNTRTSLPNIIVDNPFDKRGELNQNAHQSDNPTSPPKPAQRTKLRRRKKKAPIPPDSNLSGHLSTSEDGSKWSLVSTESEMSSMCYSENEGELADRHIDQKKTEEILKITQEIARFAEDTNNNNILNNAPDKDPTDERVSLVKNNDTTSNENEQTSLHNDHLSVDEDKRKVADEVSHEIAYEIDRVDKTKTMEQEDDTIKDIDDNQNSTCSTLEKSVSIKKEENEIRSDGLDQKTSDIPQETSVADTKTNEDATDAINTIPASPTKDLSKLEDKNTDSNTDDEIAQITSSIRQTIDYFESTRPTSSPTPKIRKNIFTKEKLLGSE